MFTRFFGALSMCSVIALLGFSGADAEAKKFTDMPDDKKFITLNAMPIPKKEYKIVPAKTHKFVSIQDTIEKYASRDFAYQPLPKDGYGYFKLSETAWFVYDDFENMVFFVTDVGVVVHDAKPDVTPYLLKVIKEVTDKPITHVIYSHHHKDHAQAMHLFPKDAIKIANDETAALLKTAKDPQRPMPDIVWSGEYVLETGGLRIEFKDLPDNWHSKSDSLAYVPDMKILLANDTFHADAAPMTHYGEAMNPYYTFQLPEILLDMYPDFEFMVCGHERIVATRRHLEQYGEMLIDMRDILFEVLDSRAFKALAEEAGRRYADGDTHWLYKELTTNGVDMAAAKFTEKWAGVIRNVPLNVKENFQMMWMQLFILNP